MMRVRNEFLQLGLYSLVFAFWLGLTTLTAAVFWGIAVYMHRGIGIALLVAGYGGLSVCLAARYMLYEEGRDGS